MSKPNENTCLIIDPGLEPAKLEDKMKSLGLSPLAVIATHGHFDHVGGVSHFKDKYQIPYYLHEADLKLSRSANFYLKLAKINFSIKTPQPDFLFHANKEELEIGGYTLIIHNFPGHSQGSCVVQHGNCLFSGDIMYKRGLGFNNFPGENISQLKSSILEIFNTFPPDSIILPGHGEAETLGTIRTTNLDLINFLN